MRGGRAGLRALLEPTVIGLGYELVDVELAQDGGESVLRVYIDHPDGITVDDCGKVSRQLSALLDVEDPIAGNYNLEISSPGLDRPLVRREDFERFAGEMVKVKMHQPVLGRRNFSGRLVGVQGDMIVVEVDKESYDLRLDDIERARLVPSF